MVPCDLSACLTLGLLLSRTLLSPTVAVGACCNDTACRSQTPPTILFLAIASYCRFRASFRICMYVCVYIYVYAFPRKVAGACCKDTALRSQTPPTILSPEVCRHRRLLQRKTRTDIPHYDPACHERRATSSTETNFAFYSCKGAKAKAS